MNTFNILINSVRNYALTSLSSETEKDAFLLTLIDIETKFEQLTLESFYVWCIKKDYELAQKERPSFLMLSNPPKYKRLAYSYALDIVTSLTKRFGTETEKW